MNRRPFPCPRCKKWVDQQFFFAVGFNELLGNKPCPDCGRVTKEVVVMVDSYDNFKRSNAGCLDCHPIMKYCRGMICTDCYYDGNLSLSLNLPNQNNYKKQVRKQEPQVFLKAVLPTAIISLIIGFFLGWLFFKKLRKKRKAIKQK